MKSIFVAAALVASVASASAADLAARPYTKAPVAVTPVANWTGCYVGGGGGYGLWNQENTEFVSTPAGSVQFSETGTTGGRGYFGTVQGGCDYQFALGSWQMVVGAFGDYDWASEKGQLNLANSGEFGQQKLDSKWAVGGRIGWLVTPQLLTYFSGGYTEAHFNQVNFNSNGPNLPPFIANYWQGQTYKGYFIGAGDEYALNFLPGLFWKTEYRFSEFDTKNNLLYNALTRLGTNTSYDSKNYDHSVRTELVYRFNWGGSVVAKY